MDKLLMAIGLIALTWVAHTAGWVGQTLAYPEFLGLTVGALAAGFVGIVALRYGAPVVWKAGVYVTLQAFKLQLRILMLGVKSSRGLAQFMGRRSKSVGMRFDAVIFLVRRNKSLSAQIEALRADISELNEELAGVVENWAPISTLGKGAPILMKAEGPVVTFAMPPYVEDFAEKANADTSKGAATELNAVTTAKPVVIEDQHATSGLHGIDLEILENNQTEDMPNVTHTRETVAAQAKLDSLLQP